MEYTEKEFAERLYAAIGYHGRNMRYRDDEEFWNLRYFIQRYISEATLMLEMSFIHRCFTTITDNEVEAVVIDTRGLENRKKSILATYHGRYYTVGIADLRAVSTDMKPIQSSGCCSTDSEAMNKPFFTKKSFTKENKETTWKESNSQSEGEYPAS